MIAPLWNILLYIYLRGVYAGISSRSHVNRIIYARYNAQSFTLHAMFKESVRKFAVGMAGRRGKDKRNDRSSRGHCRSLPG